MQRNELEQWHTAEEMEKLINEFYELVPRDDAFARRIGLPKDISEEYVPLWKLVRRWPRVTGARLLPKLHGGPDAQIRFQSGDERSVQITLAGASQQTYFNRQASLLRHPYFPYQVKAYDPRNRILSYRGRVLQSPEEIVHICVSAILEAVHRKQNDRSGTHYLLIAYEPGSLPHRLRTAAKRRTRVQVRRTAQGQQFRKVFVVVGDVVEEL